MGKDQIKKLVYFNNYRLLKGIIEDEAKVKNISESSVIEKRLIQSYFPSNNDARYWVVAILYDDSDKNSIGKTLSAIFNFNSAGVNWGSKHNNLKPLVEFARNQEIIVGGYPNGEELELHHCCQQLESIVERIERQAGEDDDLWKQNEYTEEGKYGRELLETLREEPQHCQYLNIYNYVLEHWELLRNNTRIYRLLSDLAVLEKNWINTPATRLELAKLIKAVADEWKMSQ